MNKIKVLWLSNKVQSDRESCSTGTWLDAMAQGLIHSGEVELGNITQGKVTDLTRQDSGTITQWIIPMFVPSAQEGLPSQNVIADVLKAVDQFAPDLVHIWGTEGFWGLLTARKLIQKPALLEMQGLKHAIARVFHGGLTFREQLACIGPKEILRQSTIFQRRKQFEKWGWFEREIISGHRFITIQSAWLEAQVKAINVACRIFYNDFPLRELFYTTTPWQHSENANIFCSAPYSSPFKGLHVAIRAVAILKRRFPNIQLRIAGSHQKAGIRQDGYIAWLNQEAKRLWVESSLCWLGPLTSREIISELQNCSLTILPTFIEGYCLALAEAMMLGVPTTVSFVGGATSLARDEESALFFPPGDEVMCAYQLERLLTDRALAERISRRAREVALVRNNRERIIKKQIEIYCQVIAESKSSKGFINERPMDNL